MPVLYYMKAMGIIGACSHTDLIHCSFGATKSQTLNLQSMVLIFKESMDYDYFHAKHFLSNIREFASWLYTFQFYTYLLFLDHVIYLWTGLLILESFSFFFFSFFVCVLCFLFWLLCRHADQPADAALLHKTTELFVLQPELL